jgi:hypothetical protein
MAKRKPCELWYSEVAQLMIRESLGLRQAAERLGIFLTQPEADVHVRRKEFQGLLWLERYKYFESLGSDPRRTREVLLGQMAHCAQRLMEEGLWDKAGNVLKELARIEGYVGADVTVNTFANLTQKELDEIKARLQRLQTPVKDLAN